MALNSIKNNPSFSFEEIGLEDFKNPVRFEQVPDIDNGFKYFQEVPPTDMKKQFYEDPQYEIEEIVDDPQTINWKAVEAVDTETYPSFEKLVDEDNHHYIKTNGRDDPTFSGYKIYDKYDKGGKSRSAKRSKRRRLSKKYYSKKQKQRKTTRKQKYLKRNNKTTKYYTIISK